MSVVVNVAEAKAKLSELIERAERGEDVLLARRGKPVVRLMAVEAKPEGSRAFGAWAHLGNDLPDELFLPDPADASHVDMWAMETPLPDRSSTLQPFMAVTETETDAETP